MEQVIGGNELVTAFAPAFAAGFAIQRLLQVLDPLTEALMAGVSTVTHWTDGTRKYAKAIILGVVSFLVGLWMVNTVSSMRVLLALKIPGYPAADILVSALIISGGTEGINSILKFLGYAKEDKAKSAEGTDGSNSQANGAGNA